MNGVFRKYGIKIIRKIPPYILAPMTFLIAITLLLLIFQNYVRDSVFNEILSLSVGITIALVLMGWGYERGLRDFSVYDKDGRFVFYQSPMNEKKWKFIRAYHLHDQDYQNACTKVMQRFSGRDPMELPLTMEWIASKGMKDIDQTILSIYNDNVYPGSCEFIQYLATRDVPHCGPASSTSRTGSPVI